jgi:hypothetical protein
MRTIPPIHSSIRSAAPQAAISPIILFLATSRDHSSNQPQWYASTIGGTSNEHLWCERHVPASPNESTYKDCKRPATLVIDGTPQCNKCAGERIINDYPEILGALLADRIIRRED